MKSTDGAAKAQGEIQALLHGAFRFAISLTHDPAAAEDLVQEACLAVLKAGGPWIRSYLYAAVRTRFIDKLRREAPVTEEPWTEITEARIAGADEAWNAEIPAVRNGSLDAALEGLRPEERAILYLSAVEGYTAKEISGILERPLGTVLSMMYRGKHKLREQLAPKENKA